MSTARRRYLNVRGVLAAVLAVILVALVLAALRPREQPQDLDPQSPTSGGTRALVQILGRGGTPVSAERSVTGAAALMRGQPDAVLVVVRSERLTAVDLGILRALPGDLLLIEPTRSALRELAPGVRQAAPAGAEAVEPGCALGAATLAGDADFDIGTTYEAPGASAACYRVDGRPLVVRLSVTGPRTVTVVGSRFPFTNEGLADRGNAALAMNLVGERSAAVWLMPPLRGPGGTPDKSFYDLVPLGVKLAVLQLCLAVLLTALWRARRLGPIVAEPLPVVVRSAEAVEGRARLYRSRRARDRAAEALRAGSRERLVRLLGMPSSAAQDMSVAAQVTAAVAERTGQPRATIGAALYGPAPVDDAELVGLADYLDDLEGQVRRW
ncbi:MAG TPA: DUF4350 domain-containing protein [Streptosporangiaceae bacterium]|nr:DUF4350 domain-containing protein [Streptosporangiaceae bacterium]